MELSQIFIYRITHIANIQYILEHGISHKNSLNANPEYVAIGDSNLIDTRATKTVNISNGNRTQSFGNIILGDFIPFYFGIRMPMLYVVQYGGNYVEKATNPENIVYVACKLSEIINTVSTYYFSNGHATDAFTLFYDKTKIAELPTIINWDAVKSHYWGGEENLEIKRQKQAEFLVSDTISSEYIFGFVCYNEKAKQYLIDKGIDLNKIKIFPQAYF